MHSKFTCIWKLNGLPKETNMDIFSLLSTHHKSLKFLNLHFYCIRCLMNDSLKYNLPHLCCGVFIQSTRKKTYDNYVFPQTLGKTTTPIM